MSKSITFKTAKNVEYVLTPFPMKNGFPSEDISVWLKFQRSHIPGSSLSDTEVDNIQSFMKKHKTECLTDGTHHYTIAGSMLAYCDPRVCQ